MNNPRRKEIKQLIREIENLKLKVECVLNDEQDYYDNMPENLQNSIRGMSSEDAIDNITNAIDNLDESISALQEVN